MVVSFCGLSCESCWHFALKKINIFGCNEVRHDLFDTNEIHKHVEDCNKLLQFYVNVINIDFNIKIFIPIISYYQIHFQHSVSFSLILQVVQSICHIFQPDFAVQINFYDECDISKHTFCVATFIQNTVEISNNQI